MEFKTEYYEEMFTKFKDNYPMWAEKAISYRPKHVNAIRITLRNGEVIDYNIQTNSCRFVAQSLVEKTADVTDNDCREVFAANLAEAMVTKGIGQAVLAERTGLSSACISKYLHKKSTPTITQVEKIARALGCHRDDLLD